MFAALTLAVSAMISGAAFAQSAWLSFSAEASGKVDHATAELLQARKALCEFNGKVLRIDGDVNKIGYFSKRIYVQADRLATYGEMWHLSFPLREDLCQGQVKATKSGTIETRVNEVVERIEIDFDKQRARRIQRKGTLNALRESPVRGREGLINAGYAPAGTQRVAGLECEMLRKRTAEAEIETCLLTDASAPQQARGLSLHDAMRVNNSPGKGHFSSMQRLDFAAPIDPSVFTVPQDIAIKDMRVQPE